MSVSTSTDIARFRGELVAMTPEFANALPSHIKPEKFQRVVMTVVQLQPDLLKSDRRSLFASCIKCAADGLVPDGREAALVVFGGKVQYMPMFTGIQKRIRNSGEINSIQSHVIYENDEFSWCQGIDASVTHKPKFPGDRGKPIGAYAIAKFRDGSDPQIEVMDVAAIERVRKVSRSASNGPWVSFWDEMARKTVFRRLSKWLPLDADADKLMRRDDDAGAPTVEEPSSVTLEGESEVLDDFESASRGVTSGESVTIDSDGVVSEVPDPELPRAQDFVRMIGEAQTAAEVEAVCGNGAIKRQVSKWKTEKPALFDMVDQAAAAKLEALKPADAA
jgi:recombination protein RecT